MPRWARRDKSYIGRGERTLSSTYWAYGNWFWNQSLEAKAHIGLRLNSLIALHSENRGKPLRWQAYTCSWDSRGRRNHQNVVIGLVRVITIGWRTCAWRVTSQQDWDTLCMLIILFVRYESWTDGQLTNREQRSERDVCDLLIWGKI